MLKKSILSVIGLSLIFSLSPTFASASGGGAGAISPPRPGSADAFAPTKSTRGTVISIDAEAGVLIFIDGKNREVAVTIDKKTKLKAEDAKMFDGRKNLELRDIAPDAGIKVTYQENDNIAVEVKLLKKKS